MEARFIERVDLTGDGETAFNRWMDDVADSELNRETIKFEMLEIFENRAAMSESVSYELRQQYTRTGRPEIFYPSEADILIIYGEDEE